MAPQLWLPLQYYPWACYIESINDIIAIIAVTVMRLVL